MSFDIKCIKMKSKFVRPSIKIHDVSKSLFLCVSPTLRYNGKGEYTEMSTTYAASRTGSIWDEEETDEEVADF